MLKSELIELIKDLEEGADIDETILSQGFAKPINDVEGFNSLLASNKEIQGLFDTKVSGAIKTFKDNNLQKLVDAEVLKVTGKNETPQEKQIRELTERLDKADKEAKKAGMVAKYKDTLAEKKLNPKIIDFILHDDEEVLKANIDLMANIINENAKSLKDEALKGSDYIPPTSTGTNKITWEEVQNNPKELYSKWIQQEQGGN